jgi:di/tricarboxylate transporter
MSLCSLAISAGGRQLAADSPAGEARPRFVVLNMPVEVNDASPAHSQAPHAIFCLVLMVALMLTDEIPNPIAAIIACLLMGKFRCINAESAYKAIHWPSIILIVGMMPFALALQKTGGVDLVVKGLMDVAGAKGLTDAGLPVCDVRHYRPVYLQHRHGGADGADCPGGGEIDGRLALSFAMVVAMAASAAFMTPVSSPVNTLVLGPGNIHSAIL